MNHQDLAYNLERLTDLEGELDGKDIFLNDDRLRKYLKIVSKIPIISANDLIELYGVIWEDNNEQNKEKIRGWKDDYKGRLRSMLKIGRGAEERFEEEEEDISSEINNYLDSARTKLLGALEQRCSPSAYLDIKDIVEQAFPKFEYPISEQ